MLVVSDHGFKTGTARPVDVLPFTTQQPVEWHREEGVFVLSGPGARRGHRLAQPATLFDVAPTLLYLLGLPLSEEMPGHILIDALDPGFGRGPGNRVWRNTGNVAPALGPATSERCVTGTLDRNNLNLRARRGTSFRVRTTHVIACPAARRGLHVSRAAAAARVGSGR